ncbi:MAG: TlyA family RNA methyltransferase [Deltaproteobacteria bacterium]|nr:TlyA family RNA methyltransferase [Deltaproteobacteria bacterium]
MVKIRIDKLLCDKGLAPSREKAQALIMAGCVLVSEKPVTKPGQLVDPNAKIRITGQDHPYVGRGGVKLAHALQEFGINVKGKVCVDVGASTGGFTDCLLQNGAALVYASGTIIALIKPQFEAGKDKVGKGGIVRDEKVREECVENACKSAEALGWIKRGVAISPITGADGNIEFLAWFAK